MEYIGYVHTDFKEKFGIPRQSGLVETSGYIRLVAPYNDMNMVRGLDGFTHIWVLWSCSENDGQWSPTVRPPRLGGNERMGVFATRSPFHPNSIGLSCVKLLGIEPAKNDGDGSRAASSHDIILQISGADILDGTPVYDIKPYVPYADCHEDASGGWADAVSHKPLIVKVSDDCKLPAEYENAACTPIKAEVVAIASDAPADSFDAAAIAGDAPADSSYGAEFFEFLETAKSLISQDPRPAYQSDPERIYGMTYAGRNVKFKVDGNEATIISIEPTE